MHVSDTCNNLKRVDEFRPIVRGNRLGALVVNYVFADK